MLKDITIGQYIDTGSFIHKMDSRIKLILTLFYIIALFMIDTLVGYGIFTLFTVFLIIFSKIPVKFILKGLKPMLFILVFTITLNIFMTPGEKLISFNIFNKFTLGITKEGISSAFLMSLRLLYLVVGTSLLTLTTTPLKLTDGIEMLLKPFEKIKVPAHEIAMMMTIAIRFIPTLAEETEKIIKTQTARGADFESGNIIRRAKAMIPLLVPLFVSAFRRADDLATAMDSRCYHGGKNRTRMKELKITGMDILAFLIATTFFAAIVLGQYLLPPV